MLTVKCYNKGGYIFKIQNSVRGVYQFSIKLRDDDSLNSKVYVTVRQ